VTIAWCGSMSTMDGMEMPGGWTMSMTWMRMPGQTWPDAAASFLGMWMVMMVAMMLPPLMPMLWRYRQAVVSRRGSNDVTVRQLDGLTAVVSAGYFFVWAALGMAAFPLGIALAEIEMRIPAIASAVPVAVGVVVLIAGVLQFTAWKARQLECCREARACGIVSPVNVATAWRYGLRLGLRCSACCGSLMAVLMVIGVMDLRAMAVVTAAITLERLAPSGQRATRAIGVAIVGAGLFFIARAVLTL
jgi:predicted metal-binding membrane protein